MEDNKSAEDQGEATLLSPRAAGQLQKAFDKSTRTVCGRDFVAKATRVSPLVGII